MCIAIQKCRGIYGEMKLLVDVDFIPGLKVSLQIEMQDIRDNGNSWGTKTVVDLSHSAN